MNQPISPQQPFRPEAAGQVRSGCAKAALFGCGGFLLLMLVAIVVFFVKADEITTWGLGLMEKQVVARLPAATTDEDVRRIRRGFAGVREAIKDQTVDPDALQQLQPVILRFADPNRSPSQEDVDRLIEVLEATAGIETGDSAPGTSPGVDPLGLRVVTLAPA
ncbi:MAG: hypothetical protein O7A98_02725 [Acidobacteria bacterium]|nr:hypothetical protein [Acidobacteriota bacterium]